MPSLEQLSSTLEKIYAAAADATLWEEALSAIGDATACAGVVLHLIPKDDEKNVQTLLGAGAKEFFSVENVAYWTKEYAPHCPRLAAAARWPDRPYVVDYMILSEAEMDRNPVYQWYGDYGLRYFIGSGLPETTGLRLAWSLQRTRAEGHVQQSDVETFLLFKRHLAQAIALAARIGSLERKCRLELGVLNALPYAVFALNAAGKVIFMTSRAERLVQSKDGLLVHEGRLQTRMALQQPLLDRLIQAAVSPNAKEARGGWARLHRASGRRPYLALVSEFVAGEHLMDDFPARALVIVNNPDDAAVPDQQALKELYDVTDSEARVAMALANGHSIQSASECLQVSPETLRSHLKHIFRKLGVSRQQDMVRQLVEIALIGGGARR